MAKGNPEEDVAKQARVAAALARTEAAQLRVALAAAQLGAAQAQAAAQAEAASARAAVAADKAAQAEAAAAQRASLAQQKAAQDAVAAQQKMQTDYMKSVNAIIIAKQKADDASAASAAKVAAVQAKAANDAAVAQARVEAAHAKAAAGMAKTTAASSAAQGGTNALTESLGGLASGATSVSGPIGALQGALAKMGPYGQAAAVAIGVLTIAVTAVVGTLWEMSKAAYAVIDQRDDWITLFDALGKGPGAGAKTLAMIDKMAKDLPFATSKIADWAKSLMAAGIAEKDLESAVKAVASATALMGEQGGQAAETMIKRLAEGGEAAKSTIKSIQEGGPKAAKLLAEMGLQSADLAKAMGMTPEAFAKASISAEQMRKAIEKALQQKGAGALANMLQDMPVILMKVREGFLSLFEGLGKPMGAVMEQIQALAKNFYKTGNVIAFLKPIVTAVFTTLFGWAAAAVKAIGTIVTWLLAATKAGGIFSGVIAVIKFTWSALGTIGKALIAFLAPIVTVLKMIFSNAMVLNGIKTIFTAIAAVVVTFIVVLATLGAAFAALVGIVFGVVGAIVGAVMGLVGSVASMVGEVIGYFAELAGAASGFGSSIVEGLASGIDPSAFVAKMADMASAGIAAFKGVLGIASPSKVLKKHAKDDMAGATAGGIDEGAGKVDDAMERLGAGAAKAGAGARSTKRGGNAVNIGVLNIGSRDDLDALEEKLFSIMDRGGDESPSGAPA